MEQKILVVGSTGDTRADVLTILQKGGYEVGVESNSCMTASDVRTSNFSMVVVISDSETDNGGSVISRIRKNTEAPIISVGPDSDQALVRAVLQGADAFVKEPVSQGELVARTRNLLRRCNRSTSHHIRQANSGGLDEEIEILSEALTPTELRVFKALLAREGALVARDDLIAQVWGEAVKQERLRFCIHSLRKKLETRGTWQVLTQKGVGYRLVRESV